MLTTFVDLNGNDFIVVVRQLTDLTLAGVLVSGYLLLEFVLSDLVADQWDKGGESWWQPAGCELCPVEAFWSLLFVLKSEANVPNRAVRDSKHQVPGIAVPRFVDYLSVGKALER